jgi:coproporphyrinogen III oxidase
VRQYDFECAQFFQAIQTDIKQAFGAEEPEALFCDDRWRRDDLGWGISAVIESGAVFEKGGVNYSQVQGAALPTSATVKRPELANQAFRATGVSVVMHPRNPYVPTSHFNVRLIQVGKLWWVAGGFDLTPYYGFVEDCQLWHRLAAQACALHQPHFYAEFKQNCDAYFYLKHRQEARGIGGIFFDDLNERDALPFDEALSFLRDVADAYIEAYVIIVQRRKHLPYGERERHFQALRRGRYVEFNLIYDRGTLFGLQSGGRAESILMSLPPQVEWQYQDKAQLGPAELALYEQFLPVRDWYKL